MSDVAWSERVVAALRQEWSDGKSAGQIADALAAQFPCESFTRNAIIGKVHRLGLAGRAPRPIRTAPLRTSTPPRERKARVAQAPRQLRKVKRAVNRGHGIEIVEDTDLSLPRESPGDIPLAQRKTIMQLTSRTCRWPYGEPGHVDFFYCGGGGADFPVRPYCPVHSRLARGWTPSPRMVPQEARR